MSLQNEWIQAIEYHVPEKWPNDPTEVWTQMVGVTPPKGYHFLSWSFPYTNRHKSKCARTLIYWIYGHMIKKFDPNQVLKPGDIDIWLAGHVTGLNIEKAKRVRNLASKYLKVISALGPGVVFCNQISDKA